MTFGAYARYLTFRRSAAAALVAGLLAPVFSAKPLGAEVLTRPQRPSVRMRAVYPKLQLRDGKTATVYNTGVAQIFGRKQNDVEYRRIALQPAYENGKLTVGEPMVLPDRKQIVDTLSKPDPRQEQPYVKNRLIAVFGQGVEVAQDVVTASPAQIAGVPQYTSDRSVNAQLAALGVDRVERLFRKFGRSTLAGMRSAAEARTGARLLDFSNAYRVHFTGASVHKAFEALVKLRGVSYVSPDWRISAMNTPGYPLSPTAREQADEHASDAAAQTPLGNDNVPSNYATKFSAQSLLNATGVDAVAAYDEIDRHFHQMPGQGEIVTNVSLGDLDDATATGPCAEYVAAYGATTELVAGQRYINWPSLPLIPTYTADLSGTLDGAGQTCGEDPELGEVGLDFSVMAPLPRKQQRSGEMGKGYSDMLGIAPGAQYRLVVPASDADTGESDIDAALLGAALQTPHPDVITMSLGYGYDSYGFPGRYFEADPLSESIVAAIVQVDKIVVSIASGDGVRLYTGVAIGPSGGSAPTDTIAWSPSAGVQSNLSDIAFSTAPDYIFDSGAIAAGAVTLDDLTAVQPLYASTAKVQSRQTWAETRWDGGRGYSSGMGTRVNLSAPGDNILAFFHLLNPGQVNPVGVQITGGTSATAPEIAAAAAVMLQVARLTAHPFEDAVDVRAFLEKSASRPAPSPPQSDRALHVGRQIDVARGVEALLAQAGISDRPSVPRVAIAQRRDVDYVDATFVTDTDPRKINLSGSGITTPPHGPHDGSDWNEYSWITIAPDWESPPKGARYLLRVKGGKTLSTLPHARLLPKTILAAAGMPLVASFARFVNLEYTMQGGGKTVRIPLSLTFGPAHKTTEYVAAPNVPGVVTGSTIPVSYDLTNVRGVSNPQLVVSYAARFDPSDPYIYHYQLLPLPSPTTGTVNVPVSALQGGGIYGLTIAYAGDGSGGYYIGETAYTRIQASGTARPAAPLLSSSGSPSGSGSSASGASTPSNSLEIPYDTSFQVSYNVRNVPGATGAELEISAPGPGIYGIYNPFNNPNGSVRDDNGIDTGSVAYLPLSGTSGTTTINPVTVKLPATWYLTVRVLPMSSPTTAAGEASDVSTLAIDGITPNDGGELFGGFAINPNGTDGFLSSNATAIVSQNTGSLETFNQVTGQIVSTILSTKNTPQEIFEANSTVFSDDTALYYVENSAGTVSFYKFSPSVASKGTAWTWPAGDTQFSGFSADASRANPGAATNAYVARIAGSYEVFSANMATHTFGTLYNISPALTAAGIVSPSITAMALSKTNVAAISVGDDDNPCNPSSIVTVNLTTGAVNLYPGVAIGAKASWMALDPATDNVMLSESSSSGCSPSDPTQNSGLAIYNIDTNAMNYFVPPNAANAAYVAFDPSNSRFLAYFWQPVDWDTNNNAMASVAEYDESGNLRKTIEQFDGLYPVFAFYPQFQVNASTGTAYVPSEAITMIQPFQP